MATDVQKKNKGIATPIAFTQSGHVLSRANSASTSDAKAYMSAVRRQIST